MLVRIYQTIRHHIPEGSNFNRVKFQRTGCEYLKDCMRTVSHDGNGMLEDQHKDGMTEGKRRGP
jgi:hypothetical protein